ncbi:MAG TPA: GNAT family N-acetyltransferase [Candidatus Cybelea sp.]|jgi:ribosomal protein S18 acetylase RimI-like enzyme|nr:GNAT family N-acetyltransferase [Candidatus Cybelea sp.]
MERNFVYILGEFARALPDTELYLGRELVWTLTPVAMPVFNSVAAARLDSRNVEAAIAAAQERARRKGVPLLWWVFPGNEPADLSRRLLANGFRLTERSPGMSLDLGNAGELARPGGAISIALVDGATAPRWCEVFSDGFGLARKFGEAYLPFAMDVAAKPDGSLRNYALYSSGQMVATASLALHAGIAGIYNVATLPHARGNGFASALTAHVACEGRASGATVAALQASEMGLGVYRRLGFRERYTVDMLTWPG